MSKVQSVICVESAIPPSLMLHTCNVGESNRPTAIPKERVVPGLIRRPGGVDDPFVVFREIVSVFSPCLPVLSM